MRHIEIGFADQRHGAHVLRECRRIDQFRFRIEMNGRAVFQKDGIIAAAGNQKFVLHDLGFRIGRIHQPVVVAALDMTAPDIERQRLLSVQIVTLAPIYDQPGLIGRRRIFACEFATDAVHRRLGVVPMPVEARQHNNDCDCGRNSVIGPATIHRFRSVVHFQPRFQCGESFVKRQRFRRFSGIEPAGASIIFPMPGIGLKPFVEFSLLFLIRRMIQHFTEEGPINRLFRHRVQWQRSGMRIHPIGERGLFQKNEIAGGVPRPARTDT